MKVPWMPKKKISCHASDILADYQRKTGHPVQPPIPVEDIIERYLKLNLSFEDLEEKLGMKDVLGATWVEARLICINERLFEDKSEGRLIFTCAHEIGHWVLHRRFVDMAGRSGVLSNHIICRMRNAKKPIEWQADYFASCLLMPESEVRDGFYTAFGRECLELYNEKSSFRANIFFFDPSTENWPFIAAAVCEAGGFTNVSKQAMVIRLQELGLLVNYTGERIGWRESCTMN